MSDDVKKIAGAERPAMNPLEQAEAILKAAEEATPGEWCYASYGRENLYAVGVAFGDYDQPLSGLVTAEEYTVAEPVAVDIYGAANARFIALARNTAPAIATALIEKHRALEAAEARLAQLESILAEAGEALGPFAKVANEIRKSARTTEWLEAPLFYCGDIHDPQKWTITGRGFDRAATVSAKIVAMDAEQENGK